MRAVSFGVEDMDAVYRPAWRRPDVGTHDIGGPQERGPTSRPAYAAPCASCDTTNKSIASEYPYASPARSPSQAFACFTRTLARHEAIRNRAAPRHLLAHRPRG